MKKYLSIKLIKRLDVAVLDNEKVMLDFKTGKYYWLRGIANDIWERLSNNHEVEIQSIISQLSLDYEVEEFICCKEVKNFFDLLVENKIAKYC